MYKGVSGQGTAEYVIIAVLIGIGVLLAIRQFGGSVKNKVVDAASEIESLDEQALKGISEPRFEEGPKEAKRVPEKSVQESDEQTAAQRSGAENSQVPLVRGKEGGDFERDFSRLHRSVGEADIEGEPVEKIELDASTLILLALFLGALGVLIVLLTSKRFSRKKKKKKKKWAFFRFRRPESRKDESGQVLVIGAFFVLALTMVAITVANVGMMVSEKIHLQDTVDASAYSAAVVEARYMNLTAYINRAMIANYNQMAFHTGLWATVAAHDHGTALATSIMYQIAALIEVVSLGIATSIAWDLDSLADIMRDYVHHPMHVLNRNLDQWFAQDETDVNQLIEGFNIYVLSMYQGLLYAGMQSARHDVIKQVAAKMDPEVSTTTVLGLGAETVSYDGLAQAVDYVIERPEDRGGIFESFSEQFDEMTGSAEDDDSPYLLGALAEASLDEFAAGRRRDGVNNTLRQMDAGDILEDIVSPFENALEYACEAATLTFGDCDVDIDFDLGAVVREGQEDLESQDRVPKIANKRMREVNAWALDLDIDGLPGSSVLEWAFGNHGYTSGDRRTDVANTANLVWSLEYGVPDPWRSAQCVLTGGMTDSPFTTPTKGLNAINMQQAALMLVELPIYCDDHWDGIFEPEPVDMFQPFPPGVESTDIAYYLEQVIANGTEEGVPNYDWDVDLEDVGFSRYHYPTLGAESRIVGNSRGSSNNLLTGPSIAVVGVKESGDVNGLKGLGIGNHYDMTAISRAQVYYLRNPNRPNETPNLFSPYWAPRLAPIDSGDTPDLLLDGLPFVASMGLPLRPTR